MNVKRIKMDDCDLSMHWYMKAYELAVAQEDHSPEALDNIPIEKLGVRDEAIFASADGIVEAARIADYIKHDTSGTIKAVIDPDLEVDDWRLLVNSHKLCVIVEVAGA